MNTTISNKTGHDTYARVSGGTDELGRESERTKIWEKEVFLVFNIIK